MIASRQKKKNENRYGAKKGALMIIIGVGKMKKKVDKKMGGGMTAGSMSGMV